MVDNSDNSPSRLTFPLDAPYSTFSEGNTPPHYQTKRMLHELVRISARVFAYRLSGAPVCPLLASSWSCPVESSRQDSQQAPPSVQAALPRRLSCLSSRLHSRVRCRVGASAGAAMERGEKPPGSTQAHTYRRVRLFEPAVPVLWQH